MKQFSQNLDQRDNRRGSAWLYVDELMHRTLNDYTSMLAIVRHASLNTPDEKTRGALREVDIRLKAAADTFRALGPPRANVSRSLDLELASLCEALSNSVLADRPVSLFIFSDPVTLSSYRCWQISLIIAELINNAVRHAFNSGKSGSIMVELRNRDGNIHCAVMDDGISNSVISPGRGSGIVDMLASELGGTVVRNFTGNGSTVMLLIPASESAFQFEN